MAHPKSDEADLTPTTTLSHMEWKESSFTPSRHEQPPKITVSVEILQQTHHRFGKKSCLPTTHTTTEAVADSSFQTCAAGPELLTKLKCPRAYLVKTGHRIVGITDSILSIIGTVYLRIHRGGRLSNQMVYISENFWEFYLSQTAMKDLGIINYSFPNSQTAAVNSEDKCNCPKRTNIPTRPKQTPFEPTTENILKLKSWLLDASSSSAFNQCPHLSLHSMTGEPVKLHFKEGATPYAVHTAMPIPHHWKQKVKDDLDHDEHPLCTVDLQKLNNATLHETHHTPSPST